MSGLTRADVAAVIPLTQGKIALASPEDYEELSRHTWYALRNKQTWYAVRNKPYPKRGMVRMHQQLTGFTQTDHQNRNGLDNTRLNLREATDVQNAANRGLASNNTSGHRGVSWDRRYNKWHAYIEIHGSRRHLGYFADLADAAAARRQAARAIFGEFTPIEERA